MVGWHHRPGGREFEQALGVGVGQGRLVCCSSWGHKESGTTEQLSTAYHNESFVASFNVFLFLSVYPIHW